MSTTLIDEYLAPAPLTEMGLGRTALFLDLDGVLAPLAPTPAAVGPDAARNALLARAAERLSGRVAVISGRTVADVDRILEGQIPAVAGIHGLQRRTAQGLMGQAWRHPKLGDARAAFIGLASTDPGLLVEDKGVSVALHYRGAPTLAALVREHAARLAETTGLQLQEGDMVAELRSPGPSKGDALAAFMAEPPFAGARPVFIGDDLTDEDGFAAAQAAGGFGILVGPRRETQALWRLRDVPDVLAWLAAGVRS